MSGNVCLAGFLLLWLSVSSDAAITEVTTNVCNMSLTSVSDSGESQKQVQCMCTGVSAMCNDLGLTDLPSLISFPKHIVKASFSVNHLKEIKDDAFYSGPEVVDMDLSHNQIDFVSVHALNPFKKLHRLSLSHNRIFNLPARSFDGLVELRQLDLSFNELNQLFHDAFEKLTALEELRLKGNPIHEIEPQHLSTLANLKYLDLDATMLSEVPDHLLTHATKLRVLSLANNLLTSIPTDALKQLKYLRHLDLSGNPVESIGPESFAGLESLQVLHLDRMPELEEIEAFALGDLRRLKELHCSYNFKLASVDKDAFVQKATGNLAVVEQLFLRENNLDSLPADLLRWTKDTELDLRGNPWDCRCHTQWLIYLKTKNEFQRHVRCSTPASLQHRRLSDLRNVELPCGLTILEIAFLAGLSLLAVTVCFCLVGFILHKRRYAASTEPHYKMFRKTGVEDMEYERGFDL